MNRGYELVDNEPSHECNDTDGIWLRIVSERARVSMWLL